AQDLVGFADRLRARCTGSETVGVGPARSEDAGEVPRRSAGFLLGLMNRVQLRASLAGELRCIDLALPRRPVHQADEAREVLLTLSRAEVDAEAGSIEVPRRLDPRVVDGETGRSDRELGVPAILFPVVRVIDVVGQLERLGLGRDPGR